MTELISNRIRMARQAQGLSMDELVKRIGGAISKMSISKIERGLFRPSQEVLLSIAQACKVPVTYFYRQSYKMKKFDFRIKGASSMQMKQIESNLIASIEKYMEQEESLNVNRIHFSNPLPENIIKGYADVECAAEKLRKTWCIGSQPIHSVYELLQNEGIIIIEVSIEVENFLGTSTMVNDSIPVIIVNLYKNNTNERKRFTVLHELAHLILNFRLSGDEKVTNLDHPFGTVTVKAPNEERLCERFASAMLIQEKCIIRRLGERRKELALKELISIRNLYGISISALIHRTHDLAIISDSTCDHWYKDIIEKNKLEEGWGCYPINEVADRQELLAERLKTEIEKSKYNVFDK